MDGPYAAQGRKPRPGPPTMTVPPPPPPPPPPDSDPFPQRRPQLLRGARSSPNLRQSAVPSLYDPPPAYEPFPGVNAGGQLAVGASGSGNPPFPGPPSPGPTFPGLSKTAETFPIAAQAPHRPPASPVFASPQPSETFPLLAANHMHFPPPPPPLSVSPGLAPSEAPSSDSPQAKEKSFWQTALDETKYFAGGLVSHPFEYTKHFSILRHSGALVWYRGPSTSVTVTIFSDAPLPPTRTVWLQRKGFSGNMGMNLKSLVGANTSWLDVTPSSRATPADMAEGDERGCQRDMKRFLKKAPKNLSRHVARETHVVRIPAAADDGYFRLVLCAGGAGGGGGDDDGSSSSSSSSSSSKRKVLCPSPVFRVASTSTDASVVRGASLATMPLEIGIKVGTTMATTVANKYIGPAAAVVQSRTKKIQQAKFVTKHAAHIASAKSGIEKSGIKTHLTAYEEQYAAARGGGGVYAAWQDGGLFQEAPPEVIGPDSGPVAPFPIKFDGKIARGTGRGGMELGIPTANLPDVPEDVRMRMRGVYFGWARVVPAARQGIVEGISAEWHESIVTVGPAPYATPRVAAKNVVTVHLIHEFGGAVFFDAKLKVLVMGQLRLAAPPEAGSNAALEAYGADVLLAVASLSRDNWGPVETRDRMRLMRSEMSLADRYIETREMVQKQVDRIPVHLAGVRTEGALLRDRAYGNGGIWIPR